MANFHTEGQGIITGIVTVIWRIEPVSSPRPLRHCGTCGARRLFQSSGKIRLNANGRRLDAWLIYKCTACDRTWNLPLVERAVVTSITDRDIQAMHRSDPAWVRARELDLPMLRRHCDQIDVPPDLTITKTIAGGAPETWSVIDLTIHAQRGAGQRLDRFLASELRFARSHLQSMQQTGGLQLDSASGRILKRPVGGSIRLQFLASRLTERQRAVLLDSVLNG